MKIFKIEGIVALTIREDNSESIEVRVVILVRDTSSRPVCHKCKVIMIIYRIHAISCELKSVRLGKILSEI